MPSPLTLAERRHSSNGALRRRTEREARALWRRMDTAALDRSWLAVGSQLLTLLAVAQLDAARGSDAYVAAVLAAQGLDPATAGAVNPRAFAGTASDGRPLDTLLYEPVITAKAAIGQGATVGDAMTSGLAQLLMIVGTQVTDAGRVADGVALTARRDVGGYVRMLNPPSCSRCAVLAGKWFKWNTGFQRHPHCDCRHIPTSEDDPHDLRTNPAAYFRSLTGAQQDRLFTKAGAQAIRDGGDIGQVVNARRGMHTSLVYGRQLTYTTEGITRRGLAGQRLGRFEKQAGRRYRASRTPRIMPEQIYRDATSRDDAIRLLKRFGYIL